MGENTRAPARREGVKESDSSEMQLFNAALRGDAGSVHRILSSDPCALDGAYGDILAAAVRGKSLAVIDLLFAHATPPKAALNKGLVEASTRRVAPVAIARRLLEHGADANQGGEPLVEAAYSGSPELVGLLIEYGANTSARQGQALIDAAAMGHFDAVRLLVASGADPNAQGAQALKRVLVGEPFRIDIAEFLLASGANPGLILPCDPGDLAGCIALSRGRLDPRQLRCLDLVCRAAGPEECVRAAEPQDLLFLVRNGIVPPALALSLVNNQALRRELLQVV